MMVAEQDIPKRSFSAETGAVEGAFALRSNSAAAWRPPFNAGKIDGTSTVTSI